jgi:flap endonuclease-1
MGIRDIYNILTKKHPNVFDECKIKDFHGKTIAIDILTYLYKYIRSVGEEEWINYVLLLFYKLRKYNINIICIFDGKNYPIEKRNEHEKRSANIKKIEEKHKKIIDLKNDFLKNNDSSLELYIEKINNIITKRNKSYILDSKLITKDKLLKIIYEIETKLKKQCLKVTQIHFDILKELIVKLNIQYIIADGEAEKLCSYLCINGIVDAVLSEDSDVLVYGTPIFIFRINLKKESITVINIDRLLNDISMNLLEFQDFCILCGCDYNSRIKIKSKNNKRDNGIGPVKAYNLIKKYRKLEYLENNEDLDLSSLNYKICRNIFTFLNGNNNYKYENANNIQNIDYNNLSLFLIKYNCNISIDKWRSINYENNSNNILNKLKNIKIE